MNRLPILLILLFILCAAVGVRAGCPECDACHPRVALRTNMVHDILAVPDLGVEVAVGKRFSATVQGVGAWWGTQTSTHCWRIAGGRIDIAGWLGHKPLERALTGHRLGVYGTMYTYDFELGGTGYQAPRWTFGGGVAYGYSWRVAPRLNIELSASVGFAAGREIKYRPECGELTGISSTLRRRWGLMDIGVTLVWFPGRGHFNSADYAR